MAVKAVDKPHVRYSRVNLVQVTNITERKQVEETLRKSSESLQALINSAPLAIISLDPEGNVTQWNPAAERMFGWTENEVMGKFLPYVPDDKIDEHNDLRRRVLLGEGFSNVEVCRRKKDGSPIHMSISTAPLHDSNGQVVGIISFNTDITERKRAENFQRLNEFRLETLLNLYRMIDAPLNEIMDFTLEEALRLTDST